MVGLHVYNGGVKMIGKVEIFVSIMLYHYGSDIHVQHMTCTNISSLSAVHMATTIWPSSLITCSVY